MSKKHNNCSNIPSSQTFIPYVYYHVDNSPQTESYPEAAASHPPPYTLLIYAQF
jgi:hypothetical protein